MKPEFLYAPDFETWSDINEKELTLYFAESGADREMDFDREKEEEKLYNKICNFNAKR